MPTEPRGFVPLNQIYPDGKLPAVADWHERLYWDVFCTTTSRGGTARASHMAALDAVRADGREAGRKAAAEQARAYAKHPLRTAAAKLLRRITEVIAP